MKVRRVGNLWIMSLWSNKNNFTFNIHIMNEEQIIPALSFGEKAVGIRFNPSENPKVTLCKQIFADAINQINALREETQSNEVKRMCSVAITETQTAQMWAVKAFTWKD